jgi:CBS-domain-containing membrane protein
VRDVMYDPALRELVTAIDLADTNSPIVDMDMALTELLGTFHDANVAVLPVRDRPDGRHVVGLVEQRDLLNALHRAPQPI